MDDVQTGTCVSGFTGLLSSAVAFFSPCCNAPKCGEGWGEAEERSWWASADFDTERVVAVKETYFRSHRMYPFGCRFWGSSDLARHMPLREHCCAVEPPLELLESEPAFSIMVLAPSSQGFCRFGQKVVSYGLHASVVDSTLLA